MPAGRGAVAYTTQATHGVTQAPQTKPKPEDWLCSTGGTLMYAGYTANSLKSEAPTAIIGAHATPTQLPTHEIDGDPEATSTRDITTQDVNRDIEACSERWEAAVALLESMTKRGLTPDAESFSLTIVAAAKARKLRTALQLTQRMTTCGFEPMTRLYNRLIAACDDEASVEIAQQLLLRMV